MHDYRRRHRRRWLPPSIVFTRKPHLLRQMKPSYVPSLTSFCAGARTPSNESLKGATSIFPWAQSVFHSCERAF